MTPKERAYAYVTRRFTPPQAMVDELEALLAQAAEDQRERDARVCEEEGSEAGQKLAEKIRLGHK